MTPFPPETVELPFALSREPVEWSKGELIEGRRTSRSILLIAEGSKR